MLKYVPFGSYQPDAANFHDPGLGAVAWSPTATNVIPSSVINVAGSDQVGYAPFPAFAPYSAAVDGRVQGAYSLFSSAGAVNIFAGTSDKLYSLLISSSAFTDVSISGGYSTDPESYWNFTALGDALVATNGNDNLQTLLVDVDTQFSDLANGSLAGITIPNGGTGYTSAPTLTITGGGGSGATASCTVAGGAIVSIDVLTIGKNFNSVPAVTASGGGGSGAVLLASINPPAPRAKYVATVKDFLMLGYTTDSIDGTRNQRIWWSAIGDPQSWPTPGSNLAVELQSDFQDIWGSQGVIRGIVPAVGRADAVIVFERALYELTYVGGQAIFSVTPVVGASGTYAPQSITKAGGLMFYYGESGFVSFDGSTSTPIGVNRVDSKIATELDPSFIDRIVACADPVRRVVYWLYPGSGSMSGGGNTVLCYNYEFDKWSSATITADYIFRSITFGLTLDELGDLFPDLDAMTISLDSPVFANNNWVLGGFSTDHVMGYFTGAPLTPLIDTPVFMIGDGAETPTDTRANVMCMRPVFDGAAATATCQLGTRETYNSAFAFGPIVPTNIYGSSYVRQSGRQFVARMAVNGPFNQMLGIEVDAKAAGRR